MDTVETLATRLDTMDEVRSIVRTMKALSASSIHGYQRAQTAVAAYEHTVTLGLQALLRDGPLPPRPALTGPPALIVIGSDRGLCGRFNDRIADVATRRLCQMRLPVEEPVRGPNRRPTLTSDQKLSKRPLLAVAGTRVAALLRARGHSPDHLFDLPGSAAGLTDAVHNMTGQINRWITGGLACTVSVVFSHADQFDQASPYDQASLSEQARRGERSTPQDLWLVPVPDNELVALARRPWNSRSLPITRMPRAALFAWLLRERQFVQLFHALAASSVAEHAARLVAMQGAQRSIDDRRATVQAEYRHMRQQTITTELLDIIAGYEMAHRNP